MKLTYLETWGFVSTIALFGALGYLMAASLKQFYEDRGEPKWLKPLALVLMAVGICGGAVIAVFAGMNHW